MYSSMRALISFSQSNRRESTISPNPSRMRSERVSIRRYLVTFRPRKTLYRDGRAKSSERISRTRPPDRTISSSSTCCFSRKDRRAATIVSMVSGAYWSIRKRLSTRRSRSIRSRSPQFNRRKSNACRRSVKRFRRTRRLYCRGVRESHPCSMTGARRCESSAAEG